MQTLLLFSCFFREPIVILFSFWKYSWNYMIWQNFRESENVITMLYTNFTKIRKSTFFRQINVFTKEITEVLISRKIECDHFYSTFPDCVPYTITIKQIRKCKSVFTNFFRGKSFNEKWRFAPISRKIRLFLFVTLTQSGSVPNSDWSEIAILAPKLAKIAHFKSQISPIFRHILGQNLLFFDPLDLFNCIFMWQSDKKFPNSTFFKKDYLRNNWKMLSGNNE